MAARFALLLAALVCTACGDTTATPTSPTGSVEATMTTEIFSGTLPVGGSKFYSFRVSGQGTSTATLASLNPSPTTTAPGASVLLAMGIPAGTGCAPLSSVTAGAALTAQLLWSTTPGIYCVSITDVGGLSQAVGFAIRLFHP